MNENTEQKSFWEQLVKKSFKNLFLWLQGFEAVRIVLLTTVHFAVKKPRTFIVTAPVVNSPSRTKLTWKSTRTFTWKMNSWTRMALKSSWNKILAAMTTADSPKQSITSTAYGLIATTCSIHRANCSITSENTKGKTTNWPTENTKSLKVCWPPWAPTPRRSKRNKWSKLPRPPLKQWMGTTIDRNPMGLCTAPMGPIPHPYSYQPQCNPNPIFSPLHPHRLQPYPCYPIYAPKCPSLGLGALAKSRPSPCPLAGSLDPSPPCSFLKWCGIEYPMMLGRITCFILTRAKVADSKDATWKTWPTGIAKTMDAKWFLDMKMVYEITVEITLFKIKSRIYSLSEVTPRTNPMLLNARKVVNIVKLDCITIANG